MKICGGHSSRAWVLAEATPAGLQDVETVGASAMWCYGIRVKINKAIRQAISGIPSCDP